eukprot:549750-Hanusia_phi.AAC.1
MDGIVPPHLLLLVSSPLDRLLLTDQRVQRSPTSTHWVCAFGEFDVVLAMADVKATGNKAFNLKRRYATIKVPSSPSSSPCSCSTPSLLPSLLPPVNLPSPLYLSLSHCPPPDPRSSSYRSAGTCPTSTVGRPLLPWRASEQEQAAVSVLSVGRALLRGRGRGRDHGGCEAGEGRANGVGGL